MGTLMPRGRASTGRRPGIAALCSGLMLMQSAIADDGAGTVRDDPWIFVVHEGDTFGATDELELLGEGMLREAFGDADTPAAEAAASREEIGEIRNDLEDYSFYRRMGNRQFWESAPEEDGLAEDFWTWIAEHQQAWSEVDGCFGKPLSRKAMQRSEGVFRSAFRWYLANNYGSDALYPRPWGPRVRETTLGVERAKGRANYLTCKPSGFMSTADTGRLNANRLEIGPGANLLLNYMPTFHLSAAHELGHLVQNNLELRPDDKDAPRRAPGARWIIEGAADAGAVLYTQETYGKDYFGPYANKYYRRFFLSRPYNIPLNHPGSSASADRVDRAGPVQASLLEEIEDKTLDKLDYQTNGFWYHVIERYLNGQPAGLNALYRTLSVAKLRNNATRLVDRWLNRVDGENVDGLEHVLPQFLSEYASWPEHRFDGRMSTRKWLALGFGGCREARLILADSATVTLDLAEYAGDCIRVVIGPNQAMAAPDLQVRIEGPDDMVDEIYFGWASGGHFKGLPGVGDCYELVERQGSRGGIAPCLLTPEDGISNGKYQRYLYLPEVRQAGPRSNTELVFVVSWVPQQVADAGRDFRVKKVRVTASLDWAKLAAAGDADSKTAGKAATTDYASKQGRAPVNAESDKALADVTPRDIFTGNFATLPGKVPLQMAQALKSGMEASITVRAETGDDVPANEEPSVTFLFREPLKPGHQGPIEVHALSSDGNRTGIQNPARSSRLIIDQYSDDTLRFHGTAHVCEGEFVRAMAAGGGRALCERFPPRSYVVSGAIAYPTARNQEARLQQPEISAAYRNYQNLRLARLEQRFGMRGTLVGGAGEDGPAPSAGGDPSGHGATESGRAPPPCDCGCDSADRKAGTLQCRLLCGKQWKQCGPN